MEVIGWEGNTMLLIEEKYRFVKKNRLAAILLAIFAFSFLSNCVSYIFRLCACEIAAKQQAPPMGITSVEARIQVYDVRLDIGKRGKAGHG